MGLQCLLRVVKVVQVVVEQGRRSGKGLDGVVRRTEVAESW